MRNVAKTEEATLDGHGWLLLYIVYIAKSVCEGAIAYRVLSVGSRKEIGYNKIKERRTIVDNLAVYRRIKRWKFPIGRG